MLVTIDISMVTNILFFLLNDRYTIRQYKHYVSCVI